MASELENDNVDCNLIDISTCSDEERRKLLKPSPTEDQVLELLKGYYCCADAVGNGGGDDKGTDGGGGGVKVVKQLDSYDDCNYKVEIDGVPYLLKIHNGVESDDFVASQEEAKEAMKSDGDDDDCNSSFYRKGHMNSVIHLQNGMQELLSQHGIVTNSPVKPVVGNKSSPLIVASLPVMSEPHSPHNLVVRLLTWVPGRPLSDVLVYSLEVLADAGRFLGLIDKSLDNLNFNSLAGALENVGSSASLLARGSFAVGAQKSQPSSSPLSYRRDCSLDGVREVLGMGENSSEKNAPPHQRSNESSHVTAILDESLLDGARRYHQWDGKNTADLKKFVHHIDNSRRRDLVCSVIEAFQRDIVDSGVADRFRKGVNHSDFNDANVLVNDELKMSGIIDFGDSVER